MSTFRPRVTDIRSAGPFDQVVTVTGGKGAYRKRPCAGCPWVKSNDGVFPAKAFEHSAATAYDMSDKRFACHESGVNRPSTCAGFFLRGAEHNMAVRLDIIRGRLDPAGISDGGRELHESYRSMAIANGVAPDSHALKRCR
ncbi:MAG: hypothetical protein KGZ70_13175 [Hydrogenophaga sp.]|nr:hypothetical protein [Hydrogenophaga sp.]